MKKPRKQRDWPVPSPREYPILCIDGMVKDKRKYVWMSALKCSVFDEVAYRAPYLFQTEEAAQADADKQNKGRMGNPFVAIKLEVR